MAELLVSADCLESLVSIHTDCPASSRPLEMTHVAPAGRDTPEELHRKAALVQDTPLLRKVLDSMPSMVMVLNTNRQIVAANETFLAALDSVISELVEKRPGEAVGCIRAKEGPDGCGTSPHCAACGAVNAILESQKEEKKVVQECRILVESAGGVAPMDMQVTASPFQLGEDRFVVLAVEDISQTKRLAVLQRTFFHDVLNTAGCIQGYAEYFMSTTKDDQHLAGELVQLASQLVEDIQAQRDLMHAEAGDLETQSVPVRTSHVLEEIRRQYTKHSVAEARSICLGPVWDGVVISDRRLLLRVLGNMLKNALEATAAGRTVTLSCIERTNDVAFVVHNAEVMPEEVQLQIFQRSFSTKQQQGRGIGTYSMKLFGERYLGGKLDFTSTPSEGTAFTLTIPKKPTA